MHCVRKVLPYSYVLRKFVSIRAPRDLFNHALRMLRTQGLPLQLRSEIRSKYIRASRSSQWGGIIAVDEA